jgi:hypothetical protein
LATVAPVANPSVMMTTTLYDGDWRDLE